ncbi:MAG: ROK family protein [Dehalococcoidales bacterium]|nr:ROK family protein [Dehalococcoidales bacterium]
MDKIVNSFLTLGIDLGGTKIDTALVDSSGSILSSHYRLVGPKKDPDSVISKIKDSVSICLKETGKGALALGIGVAGQSDKESGIVRSSPNLPEWKDVSLGPRLREAFGIPVFINNDVRLITWGEWQYGAGKGIRDMVCLIVGTGVGGGVISGGCMLEGNCNTAAELGHITVVAGGRKCRCPGEGCLEAYTGGWAIAERTRDAVRANPEGGQTLVEIAGSLDRITSITLAEAFNRGDPLAQRLVKDTSKYLAAGLVSIVHAFNPALIVLGGGVIMGLPDLVPAVEKRVRALALRTPLEDLRITLGGLGKKAGVIGAAAYARSMMVSS